MATTAWAVDTYQNHPEQFLAMLLRAMRKQFGWSAPAKAYSEVYDWALERRRR